MTTTDQLAQALEFLKDYVEGAGYNRDLALSRANEALAAHRQQQEQPAPQAKRLTTAKLLCLGHRCTDDEALRFGRVVESACAQAWNVNLEKQ